MRKARKRQAMIVGLTVAIAAVITLALAVLPIPQQFNMTGAVVDNPDPLCTGIFAAQGTTVNFDWSSGGVIITFIALDCSTSLSVYDATGTNGSGSFVSTGAVYQFGSLCSDYVEQPIGSGCHTADVTGNYSSPIAVFTNGYYWTPIPVIGLAVGWAVVVGACWRFLRRPPGVFKTV